MTNEEHIEQLKKLRSFHNGSYGRSIYKAIEALNQQKEGHWIVQEDNTSFVKQIPRRWVECSVCGWSFSYDRIHDKYCSKCGAHMKGGE